MFKSLTIIIANHSVFWQNCSYFNFVNPHSRFYFDCSTFCFLFIICLENSEICIMYYNVKYRCDTTYSSLHKWRPRAQGLWYTSPLSLLFVCLMVFNATFNNISVVFRGGQFYKWRKPEYPVKTTDLFQVTDKLYHIIL